jgi:hypothetical protein
MALTHLATFPTNPTVTITTAKDLVVMCNGLAHEVPECTGIEIVNLTLVNESLFAKDFEPVGLGPGGNGYVSTVSGGGTLSVPDRISGTLPAPVSTVRSYWQFSCTGGAKYYFRAVDSTTWSTKKPTRV